MPFNLAKYTAAKTAQNRGETPPSLLSLYPEGPAESVAEFGPVDTHLVAQIGKLFPEGDSVPRSLLEIGEQIIRDLQSDTESPEETLQLQGERASRIIGSAGVGTPRFRRLLILSAFHPNPYVRWAGAGDWGPHLTPLHIQHLLTDPVEGVRAQAQWESDRTA
jgi:hypothetical protein